MISSQDTQLHLQRPFFQIRLHSQDLGVRMWAYFGGFRGVEMPFSAIQNHSTVCWKELMLGLWSQKDMFQFPLPLTHLGKLLEFSDVSVQDF